MSNASKIFYDYFFGNRQIVIHIFRDSYGSLTTNSLVRDVVIVYAIVYDIISYKVLGFPGGSATFYVNLAAFIVKIKPSRMYVRLSSFV